MVTDVTCATGLSFSTMATESGRSSHMDQVGKLIALEEIRKGGISRYWTACTLRLTNFPRQALLILDCRPLSRIAPVMITAMPSLSQKCMTSLTGARVLGSRMAFVPLSNGILPIAHGARPSLPANTNLNDLAYHDSTKWNCSGRRIGHSPLSTNHGRQQTAHACL